MANLLMDMNMKMLLGRLTGIPRVGKLHTAPVPTHTVPVVGTGAHHTINGTVSFKTRSTIGTRGYMCPLQPLVTSRKQDARQLMCMYIS